ncbi:MAG TPA: hypothetical protein VFO59_07580 [Dehalococcoidia bacterium]|nr:hypothetical protein [Dehalococcoidia bacterium]
MKTVWRWSWVALLVPALLVSACGDDDGPEPTPVISSEESYAEGTVRMGIETLDTGLLKGHSYAEAEDGWTVQEIHVTAVDEKSRSWPVIEIPESGTGEAATLFFEVTIQELPRGDQVTVTTEVTFRNDAGDETERTAADTWPP